MSFCKSFGSACWYTAGGKKLLRVDGFAFLPLFCVEYVIIDAGTTLNNKWEIKMCPSLTYF
jgi:hypothetical protein